MTEREMLRLQGFPDTFTMPCGYNAAKRLAGNSVAVPVVASVIESVLAAMSKPVTTTPEKTEVRVLQPKLFDEEENP